MYFDDLQVRGKYLYTHLEPQDGGLLPYGFSRGGDGYAFIQSNVSSTWVAQDLLITTPPPQSTNTFRGINAKYMSINVEEDSLGKITFNDIEYLVDTNAQTTIKDSIIHV